MSVRGTPVIYIELACKHKMLVGNACQKLADIMTKGIEEEVSR